MLESSFLPSILGQKRVAAIATCIAAALALAAGLGRYAIHEDRLRDLDHKTLVSCESTCEGPNMIRSAFKLRDGWVVV